MNLFQKQIMPMVDDKHLAAIEFETCLSLLHRYYKAVNREFFDLDAFEPRHEGALQAYLRQAVMNRIRDEIRRSGRAPASTELDENQPDRGASALDEAIGAEAVERYEAALARLRPEEREAVVARIEMDGSYETVAQALGKPSPDAARMAVGRALLRLAEEMSRGL